MLDIHICPVRRNEVHLALELLQELAAYEQLEHALQVDSAALTRLMFGQKALVHGLLTWVGGQAVGLALYYYNASTFAGTRGLFIEDIYVAAPQRRQGIGQALFNRLIAIAHAADCGRVEWLALNGNTPALDFYKQMGAALQPDWRRIRLELNVAEGSHHPD